MKSEQPILPYVPFEQCPIRTSLGVLGRKWALLVLRDVGLLKIHRFNDIIRSNPGLTARSLSILMKALVREHLVDRRVKPGLPRGVTYHLTTRGEDVLPILAALMGYGMRYWAREVFEDSRPRTLLEVFPGRQDELLGSLREYAIAAPFASDVRRGFSVRATVNHRARAAEI